jgi:hypothetical protein
MGDRSGKGLSGYPALVVIAATLGSAALAMFHRFFAISAAILGTGLGGAVARGVGALVGYGIGDGRAH